MWQKVGNIILRNRLFILAVILLLTVFFGYFAITNLKIDNKYGNTLPSDSQVQIDYVKFKEQFGEDGTTLVIAINNKNLYTEKHFKEWKDLGDSILKTDGVLSVISEATLFTIYDNQAQEKFEARRIFSDPTYREKSIDSIKREIRKNPIYNGLLYNDSTHISLMMVGMDENYLSDQNKQDFVLKVENLANSYEKELGRMHFAGLPHIRVIVGHRIGFEMVFFIGLSVLASCVLIFYFFRSFKIVLITLAIIAISIIWALGSVGLFNFKLSILMALIPPLMIVIGVPNVVFYYIRFHQEYIISKNKIRAASSMVKNIGGAMFLTNLTTAIGFCTFTSSEKLMEFGVISSINIMVVFCVATCLVTIAISYSKDPKPRHLKHLETKSSNKILDLIIHLVTHHRTAIYLSTIVLCLLFIFGATKIKATGNLTSDLPKNDPIRKDLTYVENGFGGTIPFEVLVNYKAPGRLFKNETMEKVETVQKYLRGDTLFSKSLSYVDFIKVVDMAMHDNNPDYYKIISNRDKLKLKKYLDKFDISNVNGAGLGIKELIDTANTTIRIRLQMRDIGSASVRHKVDRVKDEIDSILNPDKKNIEHYFSLIKKGNNNYVDTLLDDYTNIRNTLSVQLANGDENLQYELDMDPDKIKDFYGKPYFVSKLRNSIDKEYYGSVITGTSYVAAQGTKYLFINMLESIVFAIISISAVMSLLFNSWKMTIVSMIPNIIPLIFIAGFMGFFHIDLKPSTLLVFGVALGITVNNAIVLLAKYRIELRKHEWDSRAGIMISLKETGLGIIYSSAIVFFGFIIFCFSKFGGTQAMGLLISLAILIGAITNLLILPSMLLSLERFVVTESFKEPYFLIHDEESDIELDNLQVKKDDVKNSESPNESSENDRT